MAENVVGNCPDAILFQMSVRPQKLFASHNKKEIRCRYRKSEYHRKKRGSNSIQTCNAVYVVTYYYSVYCSM